MDHSFECLAGDVRPILHDMLHAAALLPPPPSESDLESAEEPGPNVDRPADVVAIALHHAQAFPAEQHHQVGGGGALDFSGDLSELSLQRQVKGLPLPHCYLFLS